jgi:hypothetical protein
MLKRVLASMVSWAGFPYPGARSFVRERDERDYSKYIFRYPLLRSRLRTIVREAGKERPWYAWGVLCGVDLAQALGIDRVSVIEFGVAGGRGLIELERIASKVEEIYGIGIDVFGFDSGTGLPKPKDYRDLPQMWSEGHFGMDREKLLARLRKANLVLGPVEETVPDFVASCSAPVAFIAFDLDLYSSTMAAFKLLDADPRLLLPRVQCYFDDIMGFSYGHLNGELLAIREFNKTHDDRQISRIHGLRHFVLCDDMWVDQMYLAHIPNHEDYGTHDGMLQHHDLGI